MNNQDNTTDENPIQKINPDINGISKHESECNEEREVENNILVNSINNCDEEYGNMKDSNERNNNLQGEYFQKLDPRIIKSWKISRWIRFGFFLLVLGVPTIILAQQDFFAEISIYTLAFDLLIGAYLIITPFLYPAIEYRQWGYVITEDRVEIKHGIFFIQTTIIPIIRVQHVTISQGPINRKLGISTVTINTASGVFKIEGLSDENAKIIAESLKSKLLVRMKQQQKV